LAISPSSPTEFRLNPLKIGRSAREERRMEAEQLGHI
jgi:hypothetical protein